MDMKATLVCFAVVLVAMLTGLVPGGAPSGVVEQELRREDRELGNVQDFSRFVAETLDELRQGKLDRPEASRRVLEHARRDNPRYLEFLQLSEGTKDLPAEELVARHLARRLRDGL